MKIRIKFAKYGTMKFIGHLDMMRFFQKAIRRADIDIKYSEGFSPHQIMSFAAPLGVGIESRGEYMDIEVLSMTSTEDMKDALNQVMVEGVEVLSVTILPEHAKNAMSSVAAASYSLRMKEGSFPIDDLEGKIQDFCSQATIPYTKETKKSVVELDLKQGIYELGAGHNGTIHMLVNASSSGNIKPTMVFEKLCQFAGVEISPSAYQVTRLETYTDTAKDGDDHRFIPLADAG
ncbi:MAG: TIGR03936 family radical SAM-associated protein [Lachnospiraceae bacterium]|nr:TIGR03936 family radical SAM-associated protein [Lachnospiraceae bacterium]